MYQGGVKFSEAEEERCSKAFPLSLTGALKAPVESEEGERRENSRKRKSAETVEVSKEPAPITVPSKKSVIVKKGGDLKPTQSN